MKNKLYTDGACSPNPGKGGYGSILIFEDGKRKEFSSGFQLSTNNRMELLGIIEPLESLDTNLSIEIISDSKYIVNAINEGWLKKWIKKGWKKSDNKSVINIDLWKRLLIQLEKHDLVFSWVRGHDGHIENTECDELAVNARLGKELRIDEKYNKKEESPMIDLDDIFPEIKIEPELEFVEAKLEIAEGTTFGFTLLWAEKRTGFGEFVFFLDKDGKLSCDNETMSKKFVKKALCAMVDKCEFKS